MAKKDFEYQALGPRQLAPAVEACIRAGVSPFIWGPPGIGKSDLIRQVHAKIAQERENFGLIIENVVTLEPVDLRGLPDLSQDTTRFVRPAFIPTKGEGIMFFDEMPQGSISVLCSLFTAFLDHRVGGHPIPMGWIPVGAGNMESDKAGTNRIPTPLNNRLVHFYFEVSVRDWLAWANENGIDPRVIAYIRRDNSALHNFDPNSKEKAFPSPRSWHFVSRILGAEMPQECLHAALAGLVGVGQATTFFGFLRIADQIPDPESVIASPKTAPIPDDPAVLYTLLASIARLADGANFGNIVTYAKRLTPELGVVLMTDTGRRHKPLMETKAYIDYCTKHAVYA